MILPSSQLVLTERGYPQVFEAFFRVTPLQPAGLWHVRYRNTEIGRQHSVPSHADCLSLLSRYHQRGLTLAERVQVRAKPTLTATVANFREQKADRSIQLTRHQRNGSARGGLAMQRKARQKAQA